MKKSAFVKKMTFGCIGIGDNKKANAISSSLFLIAISPIKLLLNRF